VIGVERDSGLVACGTEALSRPENAAFAGRVRLVASDATQLQTLRQIVPQQSADWVLMNPPFELEGRISQSPDRRRRDAHVAADGLLESWCRTAAAMLRAGGKLGLVHRADALPEALAALSDQFGGTRVIPVHPAESSPAIRILVTARLGSRAPFELMPGLVLHQPDGAWTPRADAILRGRAELAV
jgi:tRNA1(Val) A37 N6-methylase TrmN6